LIPIGILGLQPEALTLQPSLERPLNGGAVRQQGFPVAATVPGLANKSVTRYFAKKRLGQKSNESQPLYLSVWKHFGINSNK
jgi:hypothetical protein